jgi:hypothetical protein
MNVFRIADCSKLIIITNGSAVSTFQVQCFELMDHMHKPLANAFILLVRDT